MAPCTLNSRVTFHLGILTSTSMMEDSERNCQLSSSATRVKQNIWCLGRDHRVDCLHRLNTKSNVHATVLEVVFNYGSVENKLTVYCSSERV
jgi:hypothetical protein